MDTKIDWYGDQNEIMSDVGYERSEPVQPKANVDMVNNPPHYNQGDIECIDAIHAALGTEGFLAYCRGNILKYNWRADHKGGIDDLEKSRWYLNKLIDTMRTKAEHQSPTKRGRK